MASVIGSLRALFGRGSIPQAVPPTKPLGVAGTTNLGGYLVSNERNPKLIGAERYRTFSNILANTSIAAASARYFLQLVTKAQWRVEPAAEGGSEGERLAEEIEKQLYDMARPWSRIVRRSAMYQFHGFSLQEWTARKREDGVIAMADIAPRPQVTIERWEQDEPSGLVTGVYQRSPLGPEIPIPRWKLLYLVDDALSDSPEGIGLFRHIADKADRLAGYEMLEGFGFEMNLSGMPIAEAPLTKLAQLLKDGDISPADHAALLQPLRDFLEKRKRNPKLGLLIDSITYASEGDNPTPGSTKQWGVRVETADTASGQTAVHVAIERVNREIARVLGTEELLLGGDGKGSLALSKNKSQTFGLMVDGTLTYMAEQLEQDFVRPIFLLNGWDTDLMPTFRTEAVALRDVEEIVRAIVGMSQAGAVLAPDDPAINEVRELLGLSAAPEIDLADLALLKPKPPIDPNAPPEPPATDGDGVKPPEDPNAAA